MSKLMDIVDIGVDELVLTSWNCNEMGDTEFSALMEEIEIGGFDEPLQVVQISDGEDDGKFLVLGGEHRYKAAMSLGHTELPCVIKKHLSEADEAMLMLWSNKRNHLRGKINPQKYVKMEQVICSRMDLQKETARKRMLMRQDQAKKAKERTKPASSSGPATDGERDTRKTMADRQRLLADAKAFHQECLLESGDTVEHGYLFVAQNGKQHLIVDESKQLHGLIAALVRVCKNDSARVDEFLVSAISNELKNWD
jgi:hypothetical protein